MLLAQPAVQGALQVVVKGPRLALPRHHRRCVVNRRRANLLVGALPWATQAANEGISWQAMQLDTKWRQLTAGLVPSMEAAAAVAIPWPPQPPEAMVIMPGRVVWKLTMTTMWQAVALVAVPVAHHLKLAATQGAVAVATVDGARLILRDSLPH